MGIPPCVPVDILDGCDTYIDLLRSVKMTERQLWLIATLRAAKGAWLSEEDICNLMIDDILFGKISNKNAYQFKGNAKGSHCSAIWQDMDEINQDIDADAIIITKDRQFAIAMSEQDVEELLLKPLMSKTVNAFKRYWNIKRKAGTQWQGKIGFSEEQEIKFIDLYKTL